MELWTGSYISEEAALLLHLLYGFSQASLRVVPRKVTKNLIFGMEKLDIKMEIKKTFSSCEWWQEGWVLRICSYLFEREQMLHSCLSNIKTFHGTHYRSAGMILHLGIALIYYNLHHFMLLMNGLTRFVKSESKGYEQAWTIPCL